MIDKDCAYYKCHTVLEDCTFCYCPVYPCKIKKLGTWKRLGKGRVWDCSGCTIIHDKKVVKEIKSSIMSILQTKGDK